MEDRLNQMNAVLQAMQKTLQCNICLDLLNNPLTTKCGHSFCGDCIQQVVKGPRNTAHCPLCMANITRRSLGHNNKITKLVVHVRKIIDSIKKDCCFEVTPSKYRPRPRPVISAEEDDSENEENDEPRRGTRKRGITDHYNPEVYIPKPRARSAKQRILTSNSNQDVSVHTDKPQTQESVAGINDPKKPLAVDVISEEHSYSSPSKQEPQARKSLIPSFTRGRGTRSSGNGQLLSGKAKPTSGARGNAAPLSRKLTKDNGKPVTTYGKKDTKGDELISVSQQMEDALLLPGELIKSNEQSTDHLSEKLGREKPADKVAKWLCNSREVGFQIGASHSTDTTSTTDSESSRVFNQAKSVALGDQNSQQASGPNNSSIKTGIKRLICSNKSSSTLSNKKSEDSLVSSLTGSKKFFKSKTNTENLERDSPDSQADIETQIFNPNDLITGTPSDPFKFIPSQKTPENRKTVKTGHGVGTRARGKVNVSRGRVRGRGRGRGIPVMQGRFAKIDDSIVNSDMSVNSTTQKHSTPIARGAKHNHNVDLSVIKPLDTSIALSHTKQIESVIVQNHDDDDGHYDLPDSCPVVTKNEFDVLISDAKDIERCDDGIHASQPKGDGLVNDGKDENLIFITPAQGGEDLPNTSSKDQGKKVVKKRTNDESVHEIGAKKKPKTKKQQTISSDDSLNSNNSKLNTIKNPKSKAEKAKEEVEAICSMFEDIDNYQLNTLSVEEEEKNKKNKEQEKERIMRQNLSLMAQTHENTHLNKTIPSLMPKSEKLMPPPKAPTRNRKVRFNANASAKPSEVPSYEESVPSTSTRSSGKTTIADACKTSRNVRYASEIKSKLMDTSKVVAVSVNVKYAKSPGWSHVEGARRDLKVRQASLNITGGEQRSINDSRTEGGTSRHSITTLASSVETNVTIDEETQDFDVEHLSSSQSKRDRVKKLKEIVSQLQEDEKEQNEDSKKSKGDNKDSKKPDAQQKLLLNRNINLSRENQSEHTKPSLPLCAETETFCIDDDFDTGKSDVSIPSKSSMKSLSRSLSTLSRKRSPKSIPVEHKDQTPQKPVKIKSKISNIPKPGRRTFSLKATTQDLHVLHSNDPINEVANVEECAVDMVPAGDNVEMLALQGNATEELKDKTTFLPSNSTVVSKPCVPHHTISPSSILEASSTPFLSRREAIKDVSSAMSPISQKLSSKIPNSQSRTDRHLQLVPFKLVGSLCSKSCRTVVDSVNPVESAGGVGRDFCLHTVPCEVYQVLMKYMSFLLSQQQHTACTTAACGAKMPLESAEPLLSTSNIAAPVEPKKQDVGPSNEEQQTSNQEDRPINQEHSTQEPTNQEEPSTLEPTNREEPSTQEPTNQEEPSTLEPTNREEPSTLEPTNREEPSTQDLLSIQKNGLDQYVSNNQLSSNKHEARAEKTTENSFSNVKLMGDFNQLPMIPTAVHSNQGNEVVPSSYSTEEMDVAIPLPTDKIDTHVKTLQSPDTGDQQEMPACDVDTDANRETSANKTHDEHVEDLCIDLAPLGSCSQSSEILIDNYALMTCNNSSSACQTQNTESSQQSASLLADVADGRMTRARRACCASGSAKADEKPAEKTERRIQGNQKNKEKCAITKTILSNELVDVEKENLKKNGKIHPAINRPRRKPLQSGQPVLENIMSQVMKDGKIPPNEKDEVTLIQSSLPQESQKIVSLFPTDSVKSSNKGQRNEMMAGSPAKDKDLEETDNDSPLRSSFDMTRRKFKRIRRPSTSGSSCEDSDLEVIIPPVKRKAKSISSSGSSNQSSAVQKKRNMKVEIEQEYPVDSEEMRDLERLDQNVWEFFGHPDEGINKKEVNQNSHVIDDLDSNQTDHDELPPATLSIPSDDEEMSSTADVIRNVNADMLLIKQMREEKLKVPEVTTDMSSQESVISTNTVLSVTTNKLFTKVDKSLTKAEALLDRDGIMFEDLCTPVEAKNSCAPDMSNSIKPNTTPPTSSKDNRDEDVDSEVKDGEAEDCAAEDEDEVDNVSHSSAYSSQSEAVSTQKQQQVKDEVEMLKARVRELEAAMVKKNAAEAGEASTKSDVVPPQSPSSDSGDESEELFSSFPDLTESTEPKLPPSSTCTVTPRSVVARRIHSGLGGPPQVVCTGLSGLEMGKVEDLVRKLGASGSSVRRSWGRDITHVVVKTGPDRSAQRTLKFLYGVAAGCWVITHQWVLDSLSTHKLLPEEDYEVLDCTGAPGPHRSRTKPLQLFNDYEFYVKPPCVEVTLEQLKELIQLCGAQVVESPVKFSKNKQSVKLVVVQTDSDHNPQELLDKYKKVCVAHDWIIECIGMYAHVCIAPYIIGSPSQSHLAASAVPLSLLEETQEL
ncbi:uncharacterized protein [Cherax quadricarinatus]